MQQIPIIIGELTKDAKMMLAYGSFLGLTIEKVVPDFSDKVQCLVRTDLRRTKEKKEEAVTKVKMQADEQDVEYLAPGMFLPYTEILNIIILQWKSIELYFML